ncbi:hypothetical protein Tco_0377755 [Tanacetum coccineum]
MKEVSKESGAKRKKSLPRKSTRSTVKRQKMEEDAEKEDLKGYLDIVPREEFVLILCVENVGIRTMTTTAAQQVALDNALVPLEKRVKISKCKMRIHQSKTQKEPTYQVFLDALALTTYYPAFLITVDVPDIYMQQFWFAVNKKDSTSYKFKMDKKNEDIVSFFKELGHKGDINSVTEVVVDQISDDFQVYGALLPKTMTNQQIRDSDAYKTYLAYATGAASPKMKRKLKKPASPSKQSTIVTKEEKEPEPAKKVVSSKKPATKR